MMVAQPCWGDLPRHACRGRARQTRSLSWRCDANSTHGECANERIPGARQPREDDWPNVVGIRLAAFDGGYFCPGARAEDVASNQRRVVGEDLEMNRVRDAHTDCRLRERGWVPLRLWEHEVAAAASLTAGACSRWQPVVGR